MTPPSNETRKPGRSFSGINILDAEIMNHSKTGRKKCEEFGKAQAKLCSQILKLQREGKGTESLKDSQRTARRARGRQVRGPVLRGKHKCLFQGGKECSREARSGPCLKERICFLIKDQNV